MKKLSIVERDKNAISNAIHFKSILTSIGVIGGRHLSIIIITIIIIIIVIRREV